MPANYTTPMGQTFVIPSMLDTVDVPQSFEDYAESFFSQLISPSEGPAIINETHLNTVLVYNDDAVVSLSSGLPKGFQFSVVAYGCEVLVTGSELILPINSVNPNKDAAGRVATFVKIREGCNAGWLMSVGG